MYIEKKRIIMLYIHLSQVNNKTIVIYFVLGVGNRYI